MAFLSGSVSFSRFQVIGGSPKRLDDNLMDKFRTHAIGKQKTLRKDGIETGWLGGSHLLDLEFDADKNVILDCLHFGMRIDAAKVPPDLLRAYVQQELDALYKAHPGQKPARLKKEALDSGRRRAEQEVKDGRFRSMRQFPILWDTRNDTLYVGATQPAVLERLIPLFRESFDKRLEPLTAGRLAYQWAEKTGITRKIENAQVAKYIPHSSGNGHIEFFWTASDPASRDYLGNEFLLWLWHHLAEQSEVVSLADKADAAVMIVKQLTLECPWAESGKQVLTADGPANLPESRRALQTGKMPRKAGLIINRNSNQYEFALQLEKFLVSGGVLPKIEEKLDARNFAEERIAQIRDFADCLDVLYEAFLVKRFGDEWPRVHQDIVAWLQGLDSSDLIRSRMARAGEGVAV
jgi:hypothetical protein